MAKKDADELVLETNLNMLRACLGFGLGWLAWQLHSPDLFLMGPVAIVCAAAGAWRLVQGLFGYARILFRGGRELKRFEKKGGKAQADGLASEKDLRKRGLL